MRPSGMWPSPPAARWCRNRRVGRPGRAIRLRPIPGIPLGFPRTPVAPTPGRPGQHRRCRAPVHRRSGSGAADPAPPGRARADLPPARVERPVRPPLWWYPSDRGSENPGVRLLPAWEAGQSGALRRARRAARGGRPRGPDRLRPPPPGHPIGLGPAGIRSRGGKEFNPAVTWPVTEIPPRTLRRAAGSVPSLNGHAPGATSSGMTGKPVAVRRLPEVSFGGSMAGAARKLVAPRPKAPGAGPGAFGQASAAGGSPPGDSLGGQPGRHRRPPTPPRLGGPHPAHPGRDSPFRRSSPCWRRSPFRGGSPSAAVSGPAGALRRSATHPPGASAGSNPRPVQAGSPTAGSTVTSGPVRDSARPASTGPQSVGPAPAISTSTAPASPSAAGSDPPRRPTPTRRA